MDHLDQVTIDDNTTEVNLDGYAQLYDGVKALATDLQEAFKDILSEIGAKFETKNDPILIELSRELNIDGASFKSSPEDLSKEDIINFYKQTKAFTQNLFAKANYLLDYAGDKAKQLNAVMVEKVPMYKFYRSIGMLFLTTSIGLSAILSTFASDEALETVAIEEIHNEKPFNLAAMKLFARYFTNDEFVKKIFGTNAVNDRFIVDFGRVVDDVNGYPVQFQLKVTKKGIELWPVAFSNIEARGPEGVDEFSFAGFGQVFSAASNMNISEFSYPGSAYDILVKFGITNVDPSKVSNITIDYGGQFILDANKPIGNPDRALFTYKPFIILTVRSEIKLDNPETFNYDGEFEVKTFEIEIPITQQYSEAGLPVNIMGDYAKVLSYISDTYPHIQTD